MVSRTGEEFGGYRAHVAGRFLAGDRFLYSRLQRRRDFSGGARMHALDWLRANSRQPIRPVYAVFGTDHYLIRESIGAVSRTVFPATEDDPAITRYVGAQAGLADVKDELFTLPFLSRRRLVIVEEADGFVTKYRKDLEA